MPSWTEVKPGASNKTAVNKIAEPPRIVPPTMQNRRGSDPEVLLQSYNLRQSLLIRRGSLPSGRGLHAPPGSPLTASSRSPKMGLPRKAAFSENFRENLDRRRGSLPLSFSPLCKPRVFGAPVQPSVLTLDRGSTRKYAANYASEPSGTSERKKNSMDSTEPGDPSRFNKASWKVEADQKSCCDSISTVFCNSDFGEGLTEQTKAETERYLSSRRHSVEQWLAGIKWGHT